VVKKLVRMVSESFLSMFLMILILSSLPAVRIKRHSLYADMLNIPPMWSFMDLRKWRLGKLKMRTEPDDVPQSRCELVINAERMLCGVFQVRDKLGGDPSNSIGKDILLDIV